MLRSHMASVKEGEPVPRFRQAREDDKFLVAKDLNSGLASLDLK